MVERPKPPFFHDADAIEAEVVDALLASDAEVVDLRAFREGPREEHEQACLDALTRGADIVVAGLLPRDFDQHRAGRPLLLVRAADGSGYEPVHLKFQKLTEPGPEDEPALEASELAHPRTLLQIPARRFRWRQRTNAVLQVAHYWRLLEATGFAGSRPRAGLIGLDQVNVAPDGAHQRFARVINWLDLTAPVLLPSPRTVEFPDLADPISALARYDSEHSYRVELAAAALASPDPDALLAPIASPECRGCVWQEHCAAQLDSDDLSIRLAKSPLDVHELFTLRRLGITTVGELARADLDSVLEEFVPRTTHREASEERLRRAHRRALLLDAGLELERQTSGPVELPQHELEIDIDIETSADDRVYLWGFWVDDKRAGTRYYRPFSSFTTLDAGAEAVLAGEALSWLAGVTQGRDAAIYHYSDYEVVRINRLANRFEPSLALWARTFPAAHFVDLFSVVKEHYFGANGLGLKVVATAATDFAWRDADPGGLNSQAWHADAVAHHDPAVREQARVRVLEYNEDDVLATWHLRRWLREQN